MEDLLQCPICYVDYNHQDRTPRQLNNCQHILCSVCLPYLLKQVNGQRQYIECPICKDKLFTSVTNVPRSLVIMQVMEATKNTRSQSSINPGRTSNQPNNRSQNFSQPSTTNSYSNYQPQSASSMNYSHFRDLDPPPPQRQTSNVSKNWAPTNPFYSNYSNDNPNPYYSHNPVPEPTLSPPVWDTQRFLRNLFNEMDANHDGSITSIELQEALRRGQGTTDFNIKTIQLLISRYDKNGDREISFDEFFDLYCNLNEEYENFLMVDEDGSGYIDLEEFMGAMCSRGYNFSKKFFKFIVDEIGKHSSSSGIKFDNYIRVMARFDYLCDYYRKTPYFHTKHNLESYLKNTFFQDFW